MHYVYIVECSDSTFYTGYAKKVPERIAQHNASGNRGAKYTRGRQPIILRYVEKFQTRSEACKREAAIKKMTRQEKEKLINKVTKVDST